MPKGTVKDPTSDQHSFGHRLLQGLIAAAAEYGHPGRGFNLLDQMREQETQRAAQAQFAALLRGPQAQGPPTRGITPQMAEEQFTSGVPVNRMMQNIQGGQIPPSFSSQDEQNFYQQGLGNYGQQGGNVQQALEILEALGKIQTPQTKLAFLKEKGIGARQTAGLESKKADRELRMEIAKMQDVTRDETNALRADWNKIVQNKNVEERQQKEADWIVRALALKGKQESVADRQLLAGYESFRQQYYDNHDGELTGIPTFEQWKDLPENRARLPQNLQSDEAFIGSLKLLQGQKTAPPSATKYKTIEEVVAAQKSGKLNYDEAAKILREQFGVK